MNALRVTTRGAVAVAVALLAAGCTTHSASPPGSSTESTTSVDSTPATEGSGPETPQARQNGGPAISVASLPVGGNVDGDAARRCIHVNWLGTKPIPHDVSVSLDGAALDPDGVFDLSAGGCAQPNDPPCGTSWTWSSNTADTSCQIAATQVVNSDQTVTLVLAGTVHCASEQACESFVGQFGTDRIQFDAQPGVVAGSSSDSAPPDSSAPSDDPTDG